MGSGSGVGGMEMGLFSTVLGAENSEVLPPVVAVTASPTATALEG